MELTKTEKLLVRLASQMHIEASNEDVKEMKDLGIDFCSDLELKLINDIYSIIQITGSDIFLTLADTKEKISVNELVKFWRENK